MYPLLGLVLLVIVLLSLRLHKLKKIESDSEEAFWDKEMSANSTIKKLPNDLPYITIPEAILSIESEEFQPKLNELNEKKILNLTGMTNADLKLEYGFNNFNRMRDAGDNFDSLLIVLRDFANAMLDADRTEDAVSLMEYSVRIGSDISSVYEKLGDYYADNGQTEKVQYLIQTVEASEFPLKESILSHLNLLVLI